MLLSVFMLTYVNCLKNNEASGPTPVSNRYYNFLKYFIILYQCKSWDYRWKRSAYSQYEEIATLSTSSWVFVQVQFSGLKDPQNKNTPHPNNNSNKMLARSVHTNLFPGCELLLIKKKKRCMFYPL